MQALDFWVRYPDYLADEILSQFEQSSDPEMLVAAREIFAADEPDVRRMPMMRKYYGAYEPLDTSLAILKSRGLVLPRTRKTSRGTNVRDFLLSEKAFETCAAVVENFPLMNWYRERIALVLRIADNRGGKALKDRQHEQKEYHDAQVGDTIPTIAQRVKMRLDRMGNTR
ncbi:hypothetical protein FHS21_003326 [Phyllobacterium trifolii]|uniref:Uncharacterized protein n=1 Tax=Phyllobacterium trifolii TaxID=300193 RepID=A0A839UDA8_9HYPH|nr:hypothetical protein [Phyllobacterium trifolii]MBB3146910.1 hypothetical protein [Phyllobacterium trifolii]